ncbi:trigger factor [Desulfobacula toluolica]|uniref:Trigger factor n=1 Tax=Desulfobacula toluolica (strain DSM 7467 / Tol2) TaxID=651182 RepID=K0ND05_DESTT|nr:trigger factor [Desulfobacula toluolica]CCK78605.1 Tig: trigger factor [Desulfobacula toluolica Tol2]
MQVKIEDKSSVKKVLSFEIPKEDVTKELNKAYNELKKKVDVKGFRKGKIPRKVLENRFSKDVHADVAPRLIQEAFIDAIKDHDLNIVGGPQMDPPELDPENAYVFDITVEVKPELDDIEFEGIALEKTKYEVSDGEIESQMYMIQKTMAKKETVQEERPVKESDFVLIDYEGFLNGESFDKTPKIENYVMGIGQGGLPKEFSEKLTGAIPVQDLDIEVPYADDYYDENLKGKTIVYKVTLKEIQEEVLPELNDDLVKDLGKFETLDDVRASIRENLGKGYEQRIKHEISEQVFQSLLEKYEFEVPEAMIEGELNGIAMEAEQAYAANNTSLEEAGLSKDVLRTQYRDVAEKQARRHLILDKVITQEKLELTDDELEKSFEEMAMGMNAPVDAVKNYFSQDPKQLEYYKHTQLEKKAVDLIIEKGNITEVEPDSLEDVAETKEADMPTEEKE